jgi:hypothetical protein
MNTEWSGSYISFPPHLVPFSDIVCLDVPTSRFPCPSLPPRLPEVYTDNKKMWNNIRDRGKGQAQEHPHLIPISALAPTVPRTLVRGMAWGG